MTTKLPYYHYPISSSSLLKFPTKSNLRKACLNTKTKTNSTKTNSTKTNSTKTNSTKTNNNCRKSLIGLLEKWINQNNNNNNNSNSDSDKKKKKDDDDNTSTNTNTDCTTSNVKVLSIYGNNENPRSILDLYVNGNVNVKGHVKGRHVNDNTEEAGSNNDNDTCNRDSDTTTKIMMGCALLTKRNPSRSMILSCTTTTNCSNNNGGGSNNNNGGGGGNNPTTTAGSFLLDGEIYHQETTNTNNEAATKNNRIAILRCSASLYYRLWYFRAIQNVDLRRVYGFTITIGTTTSTSTSTSSRNNNKADDAGVDVVLWITLLMLEKPSGNNNNNLIGGLIRCSGIDTVKELLQFGMTKTSATGVKDNNGGNNGGDDDNNSNDIYDELEKEESAGLAKFIKAFPDFATTTNPATHIWYIKYKTPSSFGEFWDIARFAINGQTRNSFQKQLTILQLRQEKQKQKQKQQQQHINNNKNKHPRRKNSSFTSPSFATATAISASSTNTTTTTATATITAAATAFKVAILKKWLYLYPIDSYIGQFRSITIMRSVGTKLSNIMMKEEDGQTKSSSSSSSGHRKQQKLSWKEFKYEYLNLARSTLEIQIIGNSLVHGDINEGNVIRNRNHNHLFLIDWDEATRPKPCYRKITNDEERMRYPKNLIDFPVQYTKQQLLHLFGSLIKKYYPMKAVKFTASSTATSTNNAGSLLGRSAVDDRFGAMISYLDR
ncbi:hypothetical protein FRACYDRAFT_241545 [Fragilariopsis cylindrus CCMP1102]|uniref:Uncharacterized protein n=1 Tax=Fragilariopsis cylindrus CCMP1102 TaxID=635003 RepID=A0A1E7F4V0_9STRA|nr:hypothetical protein FRACYDRAFT_241545 [Fragilariopsis cylindrus CCMP1102]|eukprot:OEU13211.1 hypothetical protein FRACYDRAFT_241545 [Fragilariopsis cylindrus CCMP1102]